MHTTEGKTTTFHHNRDFSGVVHIARDIKKYPLNPSEGVHKWEVADLKNEFIEMHVPFEELKMLVAKHVRNQRISEWEDRDDDSVLGVTRR